MNKIQTLLPPTTAEFLSEAISEIPSNCLFNKGVTGCGGTYLEIISNRDSIILVPNVNLVINKTNQHSNLIGVYGEVSKETFNHKFQMDFQYKKIIATYDALPKLIDWIGDKIYEFFLLIDEYHILFNSYGFRYHAISYILQNFRKFKNFCFMTATPLQEFNILEELKDLNQVVIQWKQAVPVKTELRNVYFTSKEIIKEIEKSLEEDYNLHIFINSLNTIRSVIKGITTSNFRTICSKNAEAKDLKEGGKLQIKSIVSPVCKVNFYTATAFEGVDIYDPKGKTIIVSDTNISQSLVDISTLFIQICGRLRDSEYKDQVLFICNTSNHRYLKHSNESEFQLEVDKTIQKAKTFEFEFLQLNPENTVRNKHVEIFNEIPEKYHNDYIGKFNEIELKYDPNLTKIDIQNYNILTKVFKNTINVMHNLKQTNNVQITISKPYIQSALLHMFNVLPKIQMTAKELELLFPQLGVSNWVEFSSIFKNYYDKSYRRINGKRMYVYDFTKLKLLINE